MWRAGAVGALLIGAVVAVVSTIGPAATIQPVSVNGRTWLSIPRGNHSSLILANGISGLVEAGGENEAIDLPTDLAFAGSSPAATVLQSPTVSVIVANDTHRETILDVAPGTRSLLVGETIVSFGSKARIHQLERGETAATSDIELGDVTLAGNDPPVVDGEGRVWALIAGASGTRAVAISPDTATAEFVDVTDPVGKLIVADGVVYHASPAGNTPLAGGSGALLSAGPGSVVPDLAVATLGVWAVAQGNAITVVTGGTRQSVTAPDDVTAVAVWHGSVWVISADVLYRLVGGSLDRLATIHGAQRAYTDGGRAWFVGSDAVVSVDDRQNAVVFDLSDVDIALCVQTCSAADAARYIDALPPPKPPTGDVPAEPPSQITLPPVLPTPVPTSPVTGPPLTVTPPTLTEPPSTELTSTPPTSTEQSRTTTSTSTVTPTATSTDLPEVTTPATDGPPATVPPTVAETLPPPTRPTRPVPDPPPIPTVVDTSIADTSVPVTTEPATTVPATTVAPAQGHLVLAFAGTDDPITSTSVDVIAGWEGSAENCPESPPIGTLEWSGAGQGSQLVQVDVSGPASVSINVSPGTLAVTFTVCGETAQISRTVALGQPSVDGVDFTPAAPEPGETVQAVASITTAGWSVVGASWLGGPCAQSLTALASTFSQSTTSATLSTSVAGAYCVSVVVSFTTSSATTTADGSGQVIANPSTTTTTTTTDTTTTAPETTTTTSPTTSSTTVSTEPPETTTTTTAPATTTPAPTSTASTVAEVGTSTTTTTLATNAGL